MSHFSKIKTTLKDLVILKQSLKDLSINWTVDTQILNGYNNQIEFDFQKCR